MSRERKERRDRKRFQLIFEDFQPLFRFLAAKEGRRIRSDNEAFEYMQQLIQRGVVIDNGVDPSSGLIDLSIMLGRLTTQGDNISFDELEAVLRQAG